MIWRIISSSSSWAGIRQSFLLLLSFFLALLRADPLRNRHTKPHYALLNHAFLEFEQGGVVAAREVRPFLVLPPSLPSLSLANPPTIRSDTT